MVDQTPPDTIAVRKALLRHRSEIDSLKADEDFIPAITPASLTENEAPIFKLADEGLGSWQDLILYKEPANTWLVILAGCSALATVHYAVHGPHTVTLLSGICYVMLSELALNFVRSIFSTRSEGTVGAWQGTSLVKSMVKTMISFANYAAEWHDRFLTVKDPVLALKMGVSLWVMAILGRCISTWTLAATIFGASFTLPVMYVTHQEAIDGLHAAISAVVRERWTCLGLTRRQQAIGMLAVLAVAWVRSSWATRLIGMFMGALALRCGLKPTEMAALRRQAVPLTMTVKKKAARLSVAANDFFAGYHR